MTKFRGVAPVLSVADVAVAAAYSRDKLGFAIRPIMPNSEPYWVVAQRGPVEIHLVAKDWPGGFCVLVENVDQMAEELQGRGAEFESGPTSQEYNMRDFAVSDSDGYIIVFWQPTPSSGFLPAAQVPGNADDPEEDRPF